MITIKFVYLHSPDGDTTVELASLALWMPLVADASYPVTS